MTKGRANDSCRPYPPQLFPAASVIGCFPDRRSWIQAKAYPLVNHDMDSQVPLDIYHFMIEQARDIVFLLNREGQFVYINKCVKDVLGYRQQELIGRHFSSLLHQDDGLRSGALYANCINKALKPRGRGIQLRVRHSHGKDNFHYFDVKLAAVPEDLAKHYRDSQTAKQGLNPGVAFFGVARDISKLKALENIIHSNTNYDQLTGLPNRVLLRDRVKQAMAHARREQKQFALMFIDLDGFKLVNDRLGHHAGDKLLQTIAARLQYCLREEDTLARVGGDEFVLLLPIIVNPQQAGLIAKKLLDEIRMPVVMGSNTFTLSASIGITLFPKDGENFDDLVNAADGAMYHIKRNQKNGYAFYSDLVAAELPIDTFYSKLQ